MLIPFSHIAHTGPMLAQIAFRAPDSLLDPRIPVALLGVLLLGWGARLYKMAIAAPGFVLGVGLVLHFTTGMTPTIALAAVVAGLAGWPRLGLPAATVAAYRHHADAAVRAAYVRAALVAGQADAGLVTEAVVDDAPEVRAAVVPALDVPGLLRLRDDAVTEVRLAAYAALVARDEIVGIDALLPRLATSSSEERLRLLGVWAGRAATP